MSYRKPQSSITAGKSSAGDAYCHADRDAMMRSPDMGCGGSNGGYNSDRVKNNVLEEICADIGPQDAMEWDLFDFYEPYASRQSMALMDEGDAYDQPIAFSDKEAKVEQSFLHGKTAVNDYILDRYQRPPFFQPNIDFAVSNINMKKEEAGVGTHGKSDGLIVHESFQQFNLKTQESASASSFGGKSMGSSYKEQPSQNQKSEVSSKTVAVAKCEPADEQKPVEQTAVNRPSPANRRSPAGTKHGPSGDAMSDDNSTDDMKHQQASGSNADLLKAKCDASEMSAKRARVISTATDLLEEVRSQYSFVKGADFFARPAQAQSQQNQNMFVRSNSKSNVSLMTNEKNGNNEASDSGTVTDLTGEKGDKDDTSSSDESSSKQTIIPASGDDSPAPTFAQSLKGLNDMYDKYGLRPKTFSVPSTPPVNPRISGMPQSKSFGTSSSSLFSNSPESMSSQQQFSPSSLESSPLNEGQINYRQLYMQKIMMRQNLMQRNVNFAPPPPNNRPSSESVQQHSPNFINPSCNDRGMGLMDASFQNNSGVNLDNRVPPYAHSNHGRYDSQERMAPPMGDYNCCANSAKQPYMQQQGHPSHHCQCHKPPHSVGCSATGIDAESKQFWPQNTRGRLNSYQSLPDNIGRCFDQPQQQQQQQPKMSPMIPPSGGPVNYSRSSSQGCVQCNHSHVRQGNMGTTSFTQREYEFSDMPPRLGSGVNGFEFEGPACGPGSVSGQRGSTGYLDSSPEYVSQFRQMGGNFAVDYSQRPTDCLQRPLEYNNQRSAADFQPSQMQSSDNSCLQLSCAHNSPSFQTIPSSQASFNSPGSWKDESNGGCFPSDRQPFQNSLIHQIIMDRSSAFRSHPLFPLLRDLTIADMNFDSPSFPFQLIASLPTDFNRLLQNFLNRNPMVATGYRSNDTVERVIIDALKHAHGALIGMIYIRIIMYMIYSSSSFIL